MAHSVSEVLTIVLSREVLEHEKGPMKTADVCMEQKS